MCVPCGKITEMRAPTWLLCWHFWQLENTSFSCQEWAGKKFKFPHHFSYSPLRLSLKNLPIFLFLILMYCVLLYVLVSENLWGLGLTHSVVFFSFNTSPVLISSQDTNELVAIKKFKDSEGEWKSEREKQRKERRNKSRKKCIIPFSFISAQKMRRSRRRLFGSWRCFGRWSRTTSLSWRRLFAGGGNSTWSLNMSRGSV